MIALAIHKTDDYCKESAPSSGNGLRSQCATIHKTDEFCKEPAEGSGNALRRQCATILKSDGFCKESAQKSENELRQSTCRLNMKLMSAESGSLQPFDASGCSAATKGLTSDMKLRFQLY